MHNKVTSNKTFLSSNWNADQKSFLQKVPFVSDEKSNHIKLNFPNNQKRLVGKHKLEMIPEDFQPTPLLKYTHKLGANSFADGSRVHAANRNIQLRGLPNSYEGCQPSALDTMDDAKYNEMIPSVSYLKQVNFHAQVFSEDIVQSKNTDTPYLLKKNSDTKCNGFDNVMGSSKELIEPKLVFYCFNELVTEVLRTRAAQTCIVLYFFSFTIFVLSITIMIYW